MTHTSRGKIGIRVEVVREYKEGGVFIAGAVRGEKTMIEYDYGYGLTATREAKDFARIYKPIGAP